MRARRFKVRLAAERSRLDDTLGDLERFLREGDPDAARRRLARFIEIFDRYVLGEERYLFPVLEAGGRTSFAPTTAMRREHRALRRLVAGVRAAVERRDATRALELLATTRSVFVLHHAKEEWVLHPMLAVAVSPAAEDEVIRLLQR
jgi:hemerythrin-like domain-containing protein